MTSDIRIERARRLDDNSKISVRDLLALALADLERGDFKNPARAIILIVDEPEGEPGTTNSYRANMTSPEQVGYLQTEIIAVIERWRNRP